MRVKFPLAGDLYGIIPSALYQGESGERTDAYPKGRIPFKGRQAFRTFQVLGLIERREGPMKRLFLLGVVILAGAAIFISCGGGGSDKAEKTGTVRIVGDSN
jgi:hypothetical protein